jgi:uncharacterized protein YcfJ
MLIRLIAAIGVLALPLVAAATEYRTVEHPRQECWNEQVQVQSAGAGYGGTIIGGLAGGLLGSLIKINETEVTDAANSYRQPQGCTRPGR